MIDQNETMSLTDASNYLRASETTLGQLATSGIIPAAKIGQSWVFHIADLRKYLRSEIDRQTAERIEAKQRGVKAKVKTGRGRNEHPALPDMPMAA